MSRLKIKKTWIISKTSRKLGIKMNLLKEVEQSIERIEEEIKENNKITIDSSFLNVLKGKWEPTKWIAECNYFSLSLFAQDGIEYTENELEKDIKPCNCYIKSKKGEEAVKNVLLSLVDEFTEIKNLEDIFSNSIKTYKERIRDIGKGVDTEKYLYLSKEQIEHFIALFKVNATHLIHYFLGGKKTEDKVKLLHAYLDILEYEYTLSPTIFKANLEWFQTILREDKIAAAASSKEEEQFLKNELKKWYSKSILPLFDQKKEYIFEDLYYCYDFFNEEQKEYFGKEIEKTLTKEYKNAMRTIASNKMKKERLTNIKEKIKLFMETWK
jgi:hypothetical protein